MTLRGLAERSALKMPEGVAFTWCENKVWKTRTWKEHLARIRDVAEGYGRRFGAKPREENVAIILGNSPTWIECYLAQSGTGVAVVPLDPKLHDAEVEYILADSEAVVVTTDRSHLKMMIGLAPKLPKLRGIVIVDGTVNGGKKLGNAELVAYDELRVSGGGEWYDEHRAADEDVASIIYTSGTTGKPKGAMLTHRNFITDIEGGMITFNANLKSSDSVLVVLPLFHAFSFIANFVMAHWLGAKAIFIESLRTVARDMKEQKPSVLCAVPLLAEMLHDKIEEGLQKSKLARCLMKIGLRGPVMHMVKMKLGGNLRFMVTGGAPCPKHVLEGFRRLHVIFVEGYGLTECAPVVSVTGADITKIGTIGRPCAGVEVRLADMNDQGVGELQVKGPNVMKGYFHNDKATKESFDGEWFMTGDLASIDEQGLITIRGRKKALIVNREGKNIYPEEVEICVGKDESVKDVVVIGYTQGGVPGERVGAIVYPNVDWFKAQNGGKEPEWSEIEAEVKARVQKKAAELADYKRIRKVEVYREPLERTSIGKVRRVTYKGKLDE